MYIYKKAWSQSPPPVPRVEAFALPTQSERATQKPTPICTHADTCLDEGRRGYIDIPMSIYCCFAFDWIESCEIHKLKVSNENKFQ